MEDVPAAHAGMMNVLQELCEVLYSVLHSAWFGRCFQGVSGETEATRLTNVSTLWSCSCRLFLACMQTCCTTCPAKRLSVALQQQRQLQHLLRLRPGRQSVLRLRCSRRCRRCWAGGWSPVSPSCQVGAVLGACNLLLLEEAGEYLVNLCLSQAG
jgi:hypothetical protein